MNELMDALHIVNFTRAFCTMVVLVYRDITSSYRSVEFVQVYILYCLLFAMYYDLVGLFTLDLFIVLDGCTKEN